MIKPITLVNNISSIITPKQEFLCESMPQDLYKIIYG
jgi:hypothetical protein